MEHIIFENEDGQTLICFDDEFTSIDYELRPDEGGHFSDGNFLFEIDDVRRVFEIDSMEEVVGLLRQHTKDCHGAKEAWQQVLQLFDSNDIGCDVDESEGFYMD